MKIKELLEIVDAESIDKEYILALLKEEIFAKKIPNFYIFITSSYSYLKLE